jgi:mannose-6-phosphate isomerase-like protein (cupin superfamily)
MIDTLMQSLNDFFQRWQALLGPTTSDVDTILKHLSQLAPAAPFQPRTTACADQWLPAALAGSTAGHCQPLLNALSHSHRALHWRTVPDDYAGPDFAHKFSFNQLYGLGGNVPFASNQVAIGFSLHAPGSFYPPHQHAAAEFYGVLTGAGRWQYENHAPQVQPPGALIHHPSHLPHAMQAETEPMLLVWAWLGNLADPVSFNAKSWLKPNDETPGRISR